ncbi:Regulator of nucleoside diphosphate kinase [bioreactor metagenome]|uniref:Regulator of nucleoside diphosphate kinase n=1 Tax=bioreactor metagenome TaxID=1076179 RepID=A0A644YI04_9ZZZZ
MARTICITSLDKERLQKLIETEREFAVGDKNYLEDLDIELGKANILRPEEIPNNVITMNSKFILKYLDDEEAVTYTLVYPEMADVAENRISVLAPIGTAVLGYCIGDTLEWKIPSGVVQLRVEDILFQPEASGNFEL